MDPISLSEYRNQKKTIVPTHAKLVTPKIALVILGVVLLGASFVAGMQYQKAKTGSVQSATAATRAGGSQFGGMAGSGRFQRGNRAAGSVTAINSSSITIQNRRGTSETYNITSSTTVTNDGSSASVSDIQAGDTVFITLDSSNAQNASSIDLNPSFGGNPSGNPPPSSTNDSSSSTNLNVQSS